jgi:hypothetical protein
LRSRYLIYVEFNVFVRAVVAAILFFADTLDSSWLAVLEPLRNADQVLTPHRTVLHGSVAFSGLDSKSMQAVLQGLFDAII